MFNFNFGKKKPDKKQIIIVSIVLSGIVATLSQCTGISSNHLWDLLDEVQRTLFPQTIINDILLQDPNIVKRRVKRDVTRTIDAITPEYDRIIAEANKKFRSEYVDETNDESVCHTDQCKALTPPMRICSVWVDTCPKD
jgi:hypothetical protein